MQSKNSFRKTQGDNPFNAFNTSGTSCSNENAHSNVLYESSNVFLRLDEVHPHLKSPYSGPYQIAKRIDDRGFITLINDKEATLSIERTGLKPAFIANQNSVEKPAILQRSCNKPQN